MRNFAPFHDNENPLARRNNLTVSPSIAYLIHLKIVGYFVPQCEGPQPASAGTE
jgi:hypothetical protein